MNPFAVVVTFGEIVIVPPTVVRPPLPVVSNGTVTDEMPVTVGLRRVDGDLTLGLVHAVSTSASIRSVHVTPRLVVAV